MALSKQLSVRVSDRFARRFRRKAKQYGDQSEVHREILEAFVEGRLTIDPNPEKPVMEKLYD
jgi:hypothetical protein